MNDKISIIVAGIGGLSAANKQLKKYDKQKIAWYKFAYVIVMAFSRGAVVSWGVLGIVTHYLAWVKDWHIQVFLAVVIGQISILLIESIETSISYVIMTGLELLPKYLRFMYKKLTGDEEINSKNKGENAEEE